MTEATNDDALQVALAQIDRAFGKNGTGECQQQPATMTERVARALHRCDADSTSTTWEDLHDFERSAYISTAREVFSAMGNPTDEMLDDAEGWQPKDSYQDLETERERIEFLWGVMVDCAEAEFGEQAQARKAAQAEWGKLSPEEQTARWVDWEAKHGPAPF